MFLVHIADRNLFVFTFDDPRGDGYDGPLTEDVSLEMPADVENLLDLYDWPDGSESPRPFVARHPGSATRYKIFRNRRECQSEGYVVCGQFHVEGSWAKVSGLI
jgi:hypothetical protein